MKPFEKLQQHWRSEPEWTVNIVGTREADIVALEQRYGLRIPADFREYLLVSALEPNSEAGWPTEWWTIERIKPISEECNTPVDEPVVAAQADKYLVFADYAIWCMAWAISCTEDADRGRVMVIDGQYDRFVADSFDDFVDEHIADVGAIL